eukprot:gene21496-28476_t
MRGTTFLLVCICAWGLGAGAEDNVECVANRAQASRQLGEFRTSNQTLEDFQSKVLELIDAAIVICTNNSIEAVRDYRILSATASERSIEALGVLLQREYGIGLTGTYVHFLEVIREIILNVQQNFTSAYDAWLLYIRNMVDLKLAGAVADLNDLVYADVEYNWQDFRPLVRQAFSMDGAVYGLPMGLDFIYLFYNRRLMQQYNESIPQTWDELVDIAARLNGTDFDGDGEPDHALCLDVNITHTHLLDVLAAFTLANTSLISGYSGGMLFDPMTMEPFVKNPAMAKALKTIHQLLQYTFDVDLYVPKTSNFMKGRCIMSLNRALLFKTSAIASIPEALSMKGLIGTALFPGTDYVLDRKTMQLVPCNRSTCNEQVIRSDGSSYLINRAPSAAWGGMGFGLSPLSSKSYQAIGYSTLRKVVDAWNFGRSPYTPLGPDE